MLFPDNDAIFQFYLSRHTARNVQSWFEEHGDAFQHFPWPAQFPDLNIIKPLWSVLESMISSRFLSPTPLKQLEDLLHEEWYRYSTRDYSGLI
jgi:hypothetical protein